MKTTKDKMNDVKLKVKACIGDRKGANSVIDILCYSQDEEAPVMLAAVRGLQQVFAHFFASGDMTDEAGKHTEEEDFAHTQLCKWLQEQYLTACDTILEKLASPQLKLREAALVAMMKFVEMEGRYPLHTAKASHFSFPDKLLQEVVSKLMSRKDNQESLIARLGELTEYHDIRFFLMKALKQNLSKTPVKERNEIYLSNVMELICSLQVPQGGEITANYLTRPDGEMSHPDIPLLKKHKRLFSECLLDFLKSELTASLYRRVLTKLDEKLLPCMSSPLLLADFLTESYNIGGAISLLALNGLFILINKYNLHYDGFYQKLYKLFTTQIFLAKYCARFFHLANLFLESTHLPGYLVASFVKRIARLALTTHPAGARLCLVLVANLIVRHRSCGVLVNRPGHTCESDPYLPHVEDPAKTCAMDSSLWEVKTLQNHYSPEVALEAMTFNRPIKEQQEISAFLEDSMEQVIERAVKKNPAIQVVIQQEKPFGLYDGRFKRFFSVE